MPGMTKLIQPIRSITMQNVREGAVVVCWSVFMTIVYTNTMHVLGFDSVTVLIFFVIGNWRVVSEFVNG